MNKNLKWFAVLMSALAIGAVTASWVQQFDNHATIEVVGNFNYYIDNVISKPSLDWGIMEKGITYFVELKITSKLDNTTPIKITVTAPNLPSGWIHAWTLNNTVWAIGETKFANYELTPSATALAGNYDWNTIITATEA